jgi:hypothetical protein
VIKVEDAGRVDPPGFASVHDRLRQDLVAGAVEAVPGRLGRDWRSFASIWMGRNEMPAPPNGGGSEAR